MAFNQTTTTIGAPQVPNKAYGAQQRPVANKVDLGIDARSAPTGMTGVGADYGASARNVDYDRTAGGTQGAYPARSSADDSDYASNQPSHAAPAGAGTYTPGTGQPAEYGQNRGGNPGTQAGRNLGGIFAQCHGMGEVLRRNINAAVDSFTGDKPGQARNENIIRAGKREFTNRQFTQTGSRDKNL